MLTILLGPPGCGKTALLLDRIGARAAGGRSSVLIAPESGSHQLERRLLERCGNRASQFASVTTFSKLTEDALALAGRNPRTLDAGGRVLTMYRALCRCTEGLRYFRGAARPELLRRLLELTEELKSAGVPPERFLAAADGDRLRDLGLIYAEYCALCADGALDPADRLARAMEALPETGLLRGKAVFLDDFDLLAGQKYQALGVILREAESVTFALPMGDDAQLYMEQRRTRTRLRLLAERCGVPCAEETLPAAGGRPEALRRLTEQLFDYRAGRGADAAGVTLCEAADPAEECELLAALTRQRMLAGCRLRECAVVCGDLTEYGPLLERAFARYEVPLFLSTREDILEKPALQAALGGVQALEDGLTPESVLDWLRTGLCGLDPEALDRLENYALQWGIAGKRWFAPFTLPTCGYGNPEPDEEARLAAAEEARARLAELLVPFDRATRGEHSGADFAAALTALLGQMDLENGLIGRADRLRTLGLRREAAEYAQLWNILNGALDQFAGAMAAEPMDRAVFLRLLRLTLAQYDVSAIPVSLDAVQAVTLERMAVGPLRHLMLAGGREGLLPMDKTPDSLLTERDRVALEGAGVELTQTDEERAFQQQLAVVRALSAPRETLTVTVPRRDSEGGECRVSYVVRRMEALLPLPRRAAGELLASLRLTARRPAFALACAAAENGGGSGPENAALRWFGRTQGDFLRALRDYARGPRGPIPDPELVKCLYGGRLRLTATRLEQLSACRFAYFMQYGLRARARREARVGAPEAGSFVHYVVEHAVRELCEGTDQTPQAAAERWAERYIAALPRTGAQRQAAQLRMIGGLAARVVENAWEEVNAGAFAPRAFELEFGMEGGLPPLVLGRGDDAFEVRGKIDRLDLWRGGGEDYLKVVDYKTGQKTFRLSDVAEGVNLQMFLYLLALERAPADRLAALGIARPVPAAALYLPARAPFVACGPDENDGERRARLDRELRRIGLVLDEPAVLHALEREGYRFLPVREKQSGDLTADSHAASRAQFERLLRLAERRAEQAAALVRAGDVEARPYETDQRRSICDWCDFRDACHFDPTMKKDRLRRLRAMPDAEVHAMLEREEETK